MATQGEGEARPVQPRCCPCGGPAAGAPGVSRREFLKTGGLALGGATLAGLAWSSLRAAEPEALGPAPRRPLVVKPILTYDLPSPRPKTSWRNWGGVQTREAVQEEVGRIQKELENLRASADFPLTCLPVAEVRGPADLAKIPDLAEADAVVLYAAGGPQSVFHEVVKTGKHVVFFVRHRSGPVYLWYEIVHPRYLRQHTDGPALPGLGYEDVVVDSVEELAWRLRALGGLKNALGTRIVTIGGAGGWACPKAPDLARAKWKLDIQDLPYKELAVLIQAARADAAAVESARRRAADYLKADGVALETERAYVENCFLLDQVFRGVMARAGASAITVNSCMGTIMPIAETTACLTLTLLNDDGYLAFCESDFVAVPAGLLLANLSGRPAFLNNPTFPHAGVITQAHCTAPRKMDGRSLEPVRLVTHMESDYGAAPKVEVRKGQKITNVIADFAAERWTGFLGEIVDTPYLPICRSQMDVAYRMPDARLAENMAGFHWMTVYGDYRREVGYALRKVPIKWEDLG